MPDVLVNTVRFPVGAVTVTLAVCVTATPAIVAETVLLSGVVELRVPVATPLPFVGLAGCVSVLPEPLAARTTVAPLTAFPFASVAVTVIVDVPPPAVIEVGEAVNVDCDAETGPAVTVTLAVWLSTTPPAVAEIVFAPTTVDCSVPVATPLALVALAGCVSVLPEPVALSATVTPLTGLPFASRAVTVIVDVPLPAAIEVGDAVTLDCEAETGPAVTVTLAVCVIATPLIVAETVFDPAIVELKLPVATPLPLVGAGWVNVLPEPVAASTTVAPLTGFPLASRAVTVIVEVPLPAVIDVGAAVTVDCEADTDPAVTVTVAVCVIATPLIVAEIVLGSGVVELSVPVATPLASVGPAGCVSVLPEPVAARTTVAPLMGLPLASRAVTVIVELPLPAVIEVGEAATLDRAASTGGGGGGGFDDVAALSENVVTSHGRAAVPPYIQVHCGSTVPALARTAYSASSRMYLSELLPQSKPPTQWSRPKGVPGALTPVNSIAPVVSNAPIVAVYTIPPAFTAIGRVWAGMLPPVSVPLAWATSLSAAAKLSSMPLHAEILMPPSTTRWCMNARTARIWPDTELESGKFWMFVATNVAIEYPPAVT